MQHACNLLIQTKVDFFLKSAGGKPNCILLYHKFYFLGQDEDNFVMLIFEHFSDKAWEFFFQITLNIKLFR